MPHKRDFGRRIPRITARTNRFLLQKELQSHQNPKADGGKHNAFSFLIFMKVFAVKELFTKCTPDSEPCRNNDEEEQKGYSRKAFIEKVFFHEKTLKPTHFLQFPIAKTFEAKRKCTPSNAHKRIWFQNSREKKKGEELARETALEEKRDFAPTRRMI